MGNIKLNSIKNGLSGMILIPPDKSISHRSIIFGALSKSKVLIKNISLGYDCLSTLKIFQQLGMEYEFISKRDLMIDSKNLFKADKKEYIFDCGNSGTTARLISGLLAWQNFNSNLIGDNSLTKRPMKRIIEPLELMGAEIKSDNHRLPFEIKGKNLKAVEYHSLLSSAQVKSCLLLAGLGINETTTIYEKNLSRNHSEIMLKYLGADVETGKNKDGFYTKIKKSNIEAKNIEVVGDISSCAFFMVTAAIVPNSSIIIKNVGINPTRIGILEVFNQAKIDYELLNKKIVCNEECADIKVNYTENIQPFKIQGELVPKLIDEIPILSLLATQAQGTSVIKDAGDLRNKESDRIKTIVESYKKLGVEIEEFEDGFQISGKYIFNKEVFLKTYLDHRLAMTYYVLSLINKKETSIENFGCTNTSFPEFLELMNQLIN